MPRVVTVNHWNEGDKLEGIPEVMLARGLGSVKHIYVMKTGQ